MQSQAADPASSMVDCVFQFAAGRGSSPQAAPVFFAARTSGLSCSRDGGQTWQDAYASLQLEEALPTTAVVLAPDFEHDPAVFAGLNGTILRSSDGGQKWQRARLPSPPPAISAMCISPAYAEDGTLFAGTSEDGVLISQDGGGSWVGWNFGLLDLNVLCLAISPQFAEDETVFAGTSTGLFFSTNGSRAWKEVVLPIPPDAILSLAVSPAFAQDCTLLAGTENSGLLISRDRGKSWQPTAEATRGAPVNQILMPVHWHHKKMAILLGDALWRSSNAGKTWSPWKLRGLRDAGITAALVVGAPKPALLAGLEDGRIVVS